MKLREWLRDNRALAGRRMTAAEFAAAVSRRAGRPDARPVAAQTVSRWACGRRLPRPREMLAIVHVTGGAVQPADLLADALERLAPGLAPAPRCPHGPAPSAACPAVPTAA